MRADYSKPGPLSASAMQAALASTQRPLRLAFFVHSFPLLSEAFIINQAAALIERGHEVDLYAIWGQLPHAPGQFPIAERAGLFERCRDPRFARAPLERIAGALRRLADFGGRLRLLARSLDVVRQGRWAANLRLLHEAAMLCDRGPYDVVHCQFADLAPVVLRLRRIGVFDAPVVVHVRGIDITRRPREFGRAVYERIFAEADRVWPNCEHFARKAIALGCPAGKISVFRSAIDLREFAWRGPRRQADATLQLAFVGRLVEKKGVIHAIDALAELIHKGIEARLTLLGDGPLREALQRRVVELQLENHVHFLGAGGHAEVQRLLDASDLLLAPSVTAADGDEDAPVNTLKEAMAIGLPVVATRHGGIPELVRDGYNGALVPERDAQALAQAIAELSRHRDRWERLGRNARASVEADYSLHTQTERLIALDRQLLVRRAGDGLAPIDTALQEILP